ncbi:glycosyltransferase [Pleomorphovibrio marinus]|uniref:glycosyltransferase n=1 Tax=Pleomorphovibrio marinus TaxID=2164132 RepID=UPI000E0BC854|nr:glycosyltransferase [Pleomorphovibrio marinus]
MSNIEVKSVNPNLGFRPIWSVMIPTYNCAYFLKETLESVINQYQGPEKMEIWVVDDHSTHDNPLDVISGLGNGIIKFFRQEQNVGQLKNFETCLNLAKGKIIHLLHGDDFVHPGFYEKLGKPLLHDDSIGAVFCRHEFVDENSKLLFRSKQLASQQGVLPEFLSTIASKQVIQTPSIIVKREIYEKIGGFNFTLKGCEDWEMWIRIASHGYKFHYEPQILASYRLRETSNSGSSHRTGRFVDDVLECMKIYLRYLPIYGKERRQIVKKAKEHFIQYSLFAYYRMKNDYGDYQSSTRILFKALKLCYDFPSSFRILKEIIKCHVFFIFFKTKKIAS